MNTLHTRTTLATAILFSLATHAGGAHAFGSLGANVDQFCASSGNPLATQYQPQVENNCTACHDNGTSGGSGAGKSAYSRGDLAFFCPPVTQPDPTCTDADGDGFFAEGGACGVQDPNDNNAAVYPGAPEICTDGIDNDGNGLVDAADPNAVNCPLDCTDMDGDGYSTDGGSCGPVDCDDADASINPGAVEVCNDGIDNNCNAKTDAADANAVGCPVVCTDSDGDGYNAEGGACGPMDCNDSDPSLNPGATEICDDGIDNNCDAKIDASDSVCQAMSDDDPAKSRHYPRSRDRRHGSKYGESSDRLKLQIESHDAFRQIIEHRSGESDDSGRHSR